MTISQIFIEVNGSALDNEIYSQVQDVMVDQHAHLPDMFTITIHDEMDQRTRKFAITDGDTFKLGQKIKIKAEQYDDVVRPSGQKLTLFEGEVTALEPHFNSAMIAELTVRGYDKSHRGYRETKSKAYINSKDTDLAQAVADASGLSAQADSTSTVHKHIFQNNQSDLAFLQQRAWRLGFECYVEDGKLFFREPKVDSEVCEIEYGRDLMSFQPRMTVAEQVKELVVKGWDPVKKEAIIGKSTNGMLYAKVGDSRKGEQYASDFGASKLVIVDHPVDTQAEADAIAKARMNEISGAFIEAEGKAYHRPEIRAGKTVKLNGLGERFSGTYLVTSATHSWSGSNGYSTAFTVSGTRSGTFFEQLTRQDPVNKWTGVVPAIVTNTKDPDKWGRIKLKYPWMDDAQESGWARIVSVGAGPNSGLIAVPEVDDEVLVAFEHGDFNRPYVLGGLWNGKDKPPSDSTGAAGGKTPLVRSWRSRTGHYINMFDNDDNKVEIATAGGHTITLDDKNKMLEIKSAGGMELTVDDKSGNVKVKGGGNLVIESAGNMDLKADGNVKIEAGGMLDVKAGSMLNLKAGGPASLKGSMVNIN
ncbi:MAG: VgrG-related protein [Candidatus Promineifilaceae bacterium]